ncbi:uncharacterized protein PRCAT00005775001 [Priceomyces carsonii]|uniref:uncharacterized protein n=1 Tax=Priceomyces carsonii TaxID=28549 RepID=UPI002EDAEA54|nr:unnamed protein product [Priceomyces carsonii]
MISALFVWKILIIPVVVVRTILQFYTKGTIFSRTNVEFADSLWKNIVISVEQQFVSSYTKGDLTFFVNKKFPEILDYYKAGHIALGHNLRKYGERFTSESYWFVRSEYEDNESAKEHVLMYFHGGGYAVSMFDSHLLGILALYESLPKEIQQKLSILIVDYSLTVDGYRYPTQIIEALDAYCALIEDGVKNVSFIGDSAGANLALALSRVLAYPDEALSHLSKFSLLDLKFSHLPQPKLNILISPWVEPTFQPKLPSKYDAIDVKGDLCSTKTTLGDWYVEKIYIDDAHEWINFTQTSFHEHWNKVDSIREKNKTLVLCGEREILREGIEDWLDLVDGNRENICFVLEKGGIHDCLFCVESLDFLSKDGMKRALAGKTETKFCFNEVREFLISGLSDRSISEV